MFKKNIPIPPELKNLKVPKCSKEQKIIRRALGKLECLGSPRFDVGKNKVVRELGVEDEAALNYAMGLLESLLIEDDEAQATHQQLADN